VGISRCSRCREGWRITPKRGVDERVGAVSVEEIERAELVEGTTMAMVERTTSARCAERVSDVRVVVTTSTATTSAGWIVRVAVDRVAEGATRYWCSRLLSSTAALAWVGPLAGVGIVAVACWSWSPVFPHTGRAVCGTVWLLRIQVACRSHMWVSLWLLHVHMGGDDNVSWGCEFFPCGYMTPHALVTLWGSVGDA
jgi:hypothetical protein